jgi:lysophospholipid acyltransferase (LPLAT)-like uncharacterized protein
MAAPQFVKRLFEAAPFQWAAAAIGASYINLARKTTRIDRPPPPAGGPFLLAMWHSRILMLDYLRPTGRAVITLISGHRDGKLISKIAYAGSLGEIRTVTGSSSKGGTSAIRQLMRHAREGRTLFITPDGPRGPNMRAQRGLIEIARLTGLPILPASVSTSRRSLLRSWDRLVIPHFFGRAAIRWGAPIHVDRHADGDAMLAKVEAALTACQDEADAACGVANHKETAAPQQEGGVADPRREPIN